MKYLTYKWVAYLTLQYLHRSYSTKFIYYLLGYTYTTYIPVLLFSLHLLYIKILFRQD